MSNTLIVVFSVHKSGHGVVHYRRVATKFRLKVIQNIEFSHIRLYIINVQPSLALFTCIKSHELCIWFVQDRFDCTLMSKSTFC